MPMATPAGYPSRSNESSTGAIVKILITLSNSKNATANALNTRPVSSRPPDLAPSIVHLLRSGCHCHYRLPIDTTNGRGRNRHADGTVFPKSVSTGAGQRIPNKWGPGSSRHRGPWPKHGKSPAGSLPVPHSCAGARSLDRGDVDLLHGHHRVEGTLGLTATGS